MIFKKFIGAVTALVMTMTMFVGFAGSAEAVDDNQTAFPIILKLDDDEDQRVYADNATEYGNLLKKGYVFNYNESEYVVEDFFYDATNSIFVITAKTALSLTINVKGDGYVKIGDTEFKASNTNSIYKVATGSKFDIIIKPASEQIIKSVEIGGTAYTVPANAPSYFIENYTLSANTTLNVEFGATYTITKNPEGVEHGSFDVSAKTAGSGDIVTVYPLPNSGYEIDEVSYTYEDDGGTQTKQPILPDTNGSYTFTMPAADVTVSVTFKETVTLPNPVKAEFREEYDEDPNSPIATLWEGTLNGYGSTSFKPSVTVTLNADKPDGETQSKTVTGSTIVSGSSSIYLAVVVDQPRNNIESVMLSGVTENTDTTQLEGSGNIYIDEFPIIPDTDTEEGGAES